MSSNGSERTRMPEAAFRDIVRTVCNYNLVKVDDVLSRSHAWVHVAARYQIIAACVNLHPRASYASIGALLGRDHTTVMHALGLTVKARKLRYSINFYLDAVAAAAERKRKRRALAELERFRAQRARYEARQAAKRQRSEEFDAQFGVSQHEANRQNGHGPRAA